MTVLLDADVLIGALDRDDTHHARARELLSTRRGEQVLISVVNLTEVLVAPAAATARLARAREAIATLAVSVAVPSEAVGVEAARLRARHPISLADAYCLASAKRVGATVASFDRRLLNAASSEGIDVASATAG